MRRKIKQYLPALLWYVQRRLEGGRGAVVSVRTRDICGVDRRCCMAVHMLMTSLVGGCGGGLNSLEGVDMTTVKKVKTVAAVFELPQKLGVLQYVEYEPPPREWCTGDGCLYEGLLTAEGYRKGICIKYRVWVHSRDRRRWEAKEQWRKKKGTKRWVVALVNRQRTPCGSCLTVSTSGCGTGA